MADFANAREWDPSVTEARRESDGPLGVGTTFTVVSRFGPRVVPLTYTIVRHEPDQLVVLEARSKGSCRQTPSRSSPSARRRG